MVGGSDNEKLTVLVREVIVSVEMVIFIEDQEISGEGEYIDVNFQIKIKVHTNQ